jgi:subtilisin
VPEQQSPPARASLEAAAFTYCSRQPAVAGEIQEFRVPRLAREWGCVRVSPHGPPQDACGTAVLPLKLDSLRLSGMRGMTEASTGNEREELPAWSLPADAVEQIGIPVDWPERVTRDWALAGSAGAGTRVCVVDSGIEHEHPLVGSLERAVVVSERRDGEFVVEDDSEGDLCGHGTACASIIRSLAPECRLSSVRVLGAGFTGSGPALLTGLRWAIEERYNVINLSLSTTKRDFAAVLHELADSAYFRRTVLVAAAHNMPVESYPWRFASVLSVGSHEVDDPLDYFYNPTPPVEFFARGVDVEVGWLGGGRIRSTGNSLATPHMTAISALVLAKHPELTPFQLKSLLYLTASNVGGRR